MQLNDFVISATIDSATLLVNSQTNIAIVLDAPGTEIWLEMRARGNTREVITFFQEKYKDSAPNIIEKDVLDLFSKLCEYNMIDVESSVCE